MSREYSRGVSIFLLVVLVQFLIGYFSQKVADFAGLNTPFSLQFCAFLMDSASAFFAVFLCRMFCPEMLNNGKALLKEKRSADFLGLARARKFFVISGVALLLFGISSQTLNYQIINFGVHDNAVGFAPTEDFAQQTGAGEEHDMRIAVGKKALARFISATSEELVFRWFALTFLLGLFASEFNAIALSSLFFGVAHWFARLQLPSLADQLVLVLPAAISGIGLGMIYLRLGLWVAIVFHAAGNILTAFQGEDASRAVAAIFGLLTLLATAVLIEAMFKKAFRRTSK